MSCEKKYNTDCNNDKCSCKSVAKSDPIRDLAYISSKQNSLITSLQNDINSIKAEIDSIENSGSNMQDEISSINDNITALQGEVTLLQDDVTSLQDQFSTLNGNVSALQGDVTTLQGEVTLLQDDVTSLQDQFSTLDGNVSALQGDVTTLQGEVILLQDNFAALQDQFSTLDGNVSALQGDVTTLQGEVILLQDDVAALQDQFSTLDSNVSALQGDVTTLQSDVTTLQGEVILLQDDVAALQGDVTALQDDVAILDSRVTNLEQATFEPSHASFWRLGTDPIDINTSVDFTESRATNTADITTDGTIITINNSGIYEIYYRLLAEISIPLSAVATYSYSIILGIEVNGNLYIPSVASAIGEDSLPTNSYSFCEQISSTLQIDLAAGDEISLFVVDATYASDPPLLPPVTTTGINPCDSNGQGISAEINIKKIANL